MEDETHIHEIETQAALFALGALPPAEARPFEQRIAAGCPLCRAELGAFQRTVTALPFGVQEVAPPPGLRTRLLESIDDRGRTAKKPSSSQGTIVRAEDGKWEPTPVPGVQMRSLLEKKTMLVRMAPKTLYPAHEHPEGEQCLVLEGSLSSAGTTAYAGDYTYMPAGSSHEPLYSEDGCLLLIAYS